MVIGYEKARNLMRQLDWKMRVCTMGDGVKKIELFHPEQKQEYTVRIESGRKLLRECIFDQRLDSRTLILRYNRIEAELVEAPRWFAETRWAPEDAIAAAKERGIALTKDQAVAWWKRNERRFQNLMTEYGNEILSNMDFEEGK